MADHFATVTVLVKSVLLYGVEVRGFHHKLYRRIEPHPVTGYACLLWCGTTSP